MVVVMAVDEIMNYVVGVVVFSGGEPGEHFGAYALCDC